MVRSAPAPSPKKQPAPGRRGKSRSRHRAPKQPPAVVGGRLWRLRRWIFVVVLLGAGAASFGLYELTRVPLPVAHRLAQTTFIYDASGKQIASYSEQNRVD